MTKTANYNLQKPEGTDYYDITIFNQNMDIVDEKLKEVEDKSAGEEAIQEHLSNKSNPHSVTASQVGAIPVINAMSADYNMDTILKSGAHLGYYRTNSLTLGTPYAYEKTLGAEAVIFSFANSTNFGYQIAYVSGSLPYMRALNTSGVSEWGNGFLPLIGGTLAGDLIILGTTTAERKVRVANSAHDGNMTTSAVGNFGIYDNTFTKWLVRSSSAGAVDFAEGTMNGNKVFHAGNSRPVVISSTAPTDTTALWVQ